MAGFRTWYGRYYLLFNLPVLLVLTEIALAIVDPARRVPFNTNFDLVHAFERYDASPPSTPPIVLLGNSQMRIGVDQFVVEKAVGDRVYNFGVNSMRVSDQLAMVDEMGRHGIKPRAAVIAVNLYYVDDQVVPDSLYPWNERRSPYIYFHRKRLKAGLKKIATRGRDKPYDQFAGPKVNLKPAIRVFAESYRGREATDLPLIRELPVMLDELRSRGIQPLVVLIPLNPAATAKLPQYERLLAAMRAALPPNSLDLTRDHYGEDLFLDPGHFNPKGRDKATASIAGWLREVLR